MCGLFAFISPGKPIDIETCFNSLKRLSHRGPDGSGVVLGSLGKGRFSFILDLKDAKAKVAPRRVLSEGESFEK